MDKTIYITGQDKQRLTGWLADLQEFPDKRDLPHIRQLAGEVARAHVVADSAEVPADVVTMRSRVRLRDMTTGADLECTLVYPDERDPGNGQISVLAPLGTAMLGYRIGDDVDVELPRGKVRFRVESIPYQPESAGDYHL